MQRCAVCVGAQKQCRITTYFAAMIRTFANLFFHKLLNPFAKIFLDVLVQLDKIMRYKASCFYTLTLTEGLDNPRRVINRPKELTAT